ncbi:MAG: Fic family protein, partial [Ghiorsea sp.]|nr:Fic family protein [Ghiorsea sp.]
MKYHNITYIDKIETLQGVFGMSSSLAEAIGVSRRSLLNWRDRPESISQKHRLNIDVLYCKHLIVPEWDKKAKANPAVLLPDAMTNNDAWLMPFLRRLSYGTIEIETNMAKADFDKIIDTEKLPKDMTRERFYEAINTFFTLKWIWKKIVEAGEHFTITEEAIKGLHTGFMRGIREDAGFFSKNIRVMGQLENFSTTLPEDIPEEINRWVYKCAGVKTLADIAEAHAYFIAIHPFGDGNGRVGRALVMVQCLNAGLMPPVFDGKNRAMY